MAFLTSSPKSPVPVIALSLSQTARIRISWDILSVSAALGRLRMSVNKENFVRFDAPNEMDPPVRSGTNKVLDVKLGSEYAFELRADRTEALVAQYVVKTREQDVLRLSDAIHIHIPAKQAVYQLQIEPGIESVQVHFRHPPAVCSDPRSQTHAGQQSGHGSLGAKLYVRRDLPGRH